MANELVIDPVFRMRHRFSRSTDPDGSEVLHVESEVDPGGGVTAHVHPAMTETFTERPRHRVRSMGSGGSPGGRSA